MHRLHLRHPILADSDCQDEMKDVFAQPDLVDTVAGRLGSLPQ